MHGRKNSALEILLMKNQEKNRKYADILGNSTQQKTIGVFETEKSTSKHNAGQQAMLTYSAESEGMIRRLQFTITIEMFFKMQLIGERLITV
ncbi:hypothetical protein V1477_002174 [Vespula maculifrons]|uniref:Uncharacterized protein n=1 Tax=Vespula maculifrons TaxID=7453 RepID=A0ABD2CX64_VESMC